VASPPRSVAASAHDAPAAASSPAGAGGRAAAAGEQRKRPRQFYGVYLLASLHPSHSRSAYIGFTVNPPRRIRQHNGEVKGGAWKTHKKRPWEMQLVLHGFPSQVVALQFEWAWQQPLKSKPVREAMFRAGLSERGDAARKVKVLCEMLSVPPWSRYPLTLRWLKPENEAKLLRGCRPLPQNIRTTMGSVDTIECVPRHPSRASDPRCDDDDDDALSPCLLALASRDFAPTVQHGRADHNTLFTRCAWAYAAAGCVRTAQYRRDGR
jgi:structure-specific endonuclease subunit SLX1